MFILRAAFNRVVKDIFKIAGLDLHRISAQTNPSFQLLTCLDRFGVDFVFDIGANIGQFSSELRSVGFRGNIVSFEPLPDAFKRLSSLSAPDSSWQIHPQCAVGDVDGQIEINIAGNSVSSSILPMLAAHSTAAIGSAYVDKIEVPIVRLDSVAKLYLKDSTKYFIKIDTQGFEWQVLNGACETLANAQGVLCELSLVPLYEGQRLWMEVIERLKSEGFTLWAIQKGFTDTRDGRTLQVDAIFFRTT